MMHCGSPTPVQLLHVASGSASKNSLLEVVPKIICACRVGRVLCRTGTHVFLDVKAPAQ